MGCSGTEREENEQKLCRCCAGQLSLRSLGGR